MWQKSCTPCEPTLRTAIVGLIQPDPSSSVLGIPSVFAIKAPRGIPLSPSVINVRQSVPSGKKMARIPLGGRDGGTVESVTLSCDSPPFEIDFSR